MLSHNSTMQYRAVWPLQTLRTCSNAQTCTHNLHATPQPHSEDSIRQYSPRLRRLAAIALMFPFPFKRGEGCSGKNGPCAASCCAQESEGRLGPEYVRMWVVIFLLCWAANPEWDIAGDRGCASSDAGLGSKSSLKDRLLTLQQQQAS